MKKSKFNLSHDASLTASMGKLIPFMCLDCLPNDSHRFKLQSFVRAQPMLAPLMHRVNLYAQYWFVPYRLLWNDWETFITGGNDGNEDSGLVFPTVKVTPTTSSLADYFGLPVNGKELEVSAMPFRAYAEIWNSRYRDEDLQGEVGVVYDGGVDEATNTDLLNCSWAKDRFTISRPYTQRGSQISVPVDSLHVTGTGMRLVSSDITASILNFPFTFIAYQNNTSGPAKRTITVDYFQFTANSSFLADSVRLNNSTFSFNVDYVSSSWSGKDVPGTTYTPGVWTLTYSNALYGTLVVKSTTSNIFGRYSSGRPSSLTVVLNVNSLTALESGDASTTAVWDSKTSPTINVKYNVSTSTSSINIRDLRVASQIQRYQERSLQYGNRYEEFIQREFGIKPRDSRIQRPEYLGGGSSVLQISEVLQTAEGENTGVGTMRGHGVSAFSTRGVRFRAPEHGVIIGLLSIRPHGVYTQGVEKFWRKFSKFDYYTPELASVGMQEIWQSELYANGENFDTVFGYEGRYDEYRKLPNRVSGEFRDLLDYWNLARKFDEPPVLNGDFITMNPSKRIFAEQTQDSFLIMLRNSISSFRCVPKVAKNLLR